jgi:acetoacetate decarboxylase
MAILSNREFMYPITPHGRTSLLDLQTEPSNRVAGNSLIIGFEADPEVVREYVPEPLELDGSGLVYLWSYDGWFYSDRMSREFVSEGRSNYAESFFWIPCDYQGERYHYMLYSWVTRDWLAFQGRHAGMPHKVAKVRMTRFHRADPVYYGPHEGVRVAVSVDCAGQVLRAHCDLEHTVELDELPIRISDDYCPRFLGHRYFWDICQDRPAVSDLVAHWGDHMRLGQVWGGPAGVAFFDAENEEVLPFQPRRVLGGWWFTLLFDHTTSPPVVIHEYLD